MPVQIERVQFAFFQQRGQPVGNEPALAIAMFDPARPAADDGRIQRALPWPDAACVAPVFDVAASARLEIASVFNDRIDAPDDIEDEEIAGHGDAVFVFGNDREKLMPSGVKLLDRVPGRELTRFPPPSNSIQSYIVLALVRRTRRGTTSGGIQVPVTQDALVIVPG
jgi:hypothetical protein